MKILHTADWHLGAGIGSEKRYDEFRQTLAFVLETIRNKKVDCVVIAGDVFDVPQPPNRAVEMYYKFLTDCADAGVQDVIVIAGNHDSAAFLEAPALLLRRLRVHVFGSLRSSLPEHLVVLKDAVIGAVPFLHERDVRGGGRTYHEHKQALRTGTVAVFQAVAEIAKTSYPELPLLMTAHIWAATRKEVAAQEEIGNLEPIAVEDLPEETDLFLLGHVHSSYAVDSRTRYSGSLLPMNFGESPKKLTILDTADLQNPEIVPVPSFCNLLEIRGEIGVILQKLDELTGKQNDSMPHLLKVVNTGAFRTTLRREILEKIKDHPSIRLVSCHNTEPNPAAVRRGAGTEKLSELTPETVFRRLLQEQEIAGQEELLELFREVAGTVGGAEGMKRT